MLASWALHGIWTSLKVKVQGRNVYYDSNEVGQRLF